MVENLSDENKIFLSELSSKIGDKVFYLIYGYLNSESLIDYNEMSDGGIADLIDELDSDDTLNFIELLIDFKKQELAETQEEIDYAQIIKKLKRDVATLKKKLAQPSKLINTKQFEERYGLTRVQQKGLRGKITDPLPYSMVNDKTIMYEPEEVENGTKPFTVTLPIEVIEKLEYYSERLGMKKSHLVMCSLLLDEEEED